MIFSFAAAALVCVSQPVESSSFKINQMFKTEGIFRQLSMEQAVLRIHDILVWIRIRIRFKFSCLSLFEGTFTSFLKDKKSKRSQKTVGIKVFLSVFA